MRNLPCFPLWLFPKKKQKNDQKEKATKEQKTMINQHTLCFRIENSKTQSKPWVFPHGFQIPQRFKVTITGPLTSLHESQVKSNPSPLENVNFLILNQKPLNLLFSTDQFLYEFSKKKPLPRKISEYSKQLKERRKILLFYGKLSKKSLRHYVHQAQRLSGDFSRNFFGLLEKRLDVVIFRSGFAKTLLQARECILHQHICVNQTIITNPKYVVQPADIIGIQGPRKHSLEQKVKHGSRKRLMALHSKILKHQNPPCFQTSVHQNPHEWIHTFLSLLRVLTLKRMSYKKKVFHPKNRDLFMTRALMTPKTPGDLHDSLVKSSDVPAPRTTQLNHLVFVKIKKLDVFNVFQSKKEKLLKQSGEKQKDSGPRKKSPHQSPLFGSFRMKNLKQGDTQVHPMIWPWGSQESLSHPTKRERDAFKQPAFQTKTTGVSQKRGLFPLERRSESAGTGNSLDKKTFFFLVKLFKNSESIPTIFGGKITDFFEKSRSAFKSKSVPYTLGTQPTRKNPQRMRPLHLEMSYRKKILIFLYSPQRIPFPFCIHMDLFKRSLFLF